MHWALANLHYTATAQPKSSFPDRTTHPIAPLVNSTHTLARDATFSIATLAGATSYIKLHRYFHLNGFGAFCSDC